MAQHQDFSEQRLYFRHDVGEGCTLTFEGASHACRVVNASLGGALVSTADLPPIGATVVLDMAHMGAIEGTVVRQGASQSAIRFDPEEAKAVGINDMITFVLNQDLLDSAAR